jgi:hypothetical protein
METALTIVSSLLVAALVGLWTLASKIFMQKKIIDETDPIKEANKELLEKVKNLKEQLDPIERRKKLLKEEYEIGGRHGYLSRKSDKAACCLACFNSADIRISILPNRTKSVKLVCPDPSCGAKYDNPNYDPKLSNN